MGLGGCASLEVIQTGASLVQTGLTYLITKQEAVEVIGKECLFTNYIFYSPEFGDRLTDDEIRQINTHNEQVEELCK